MSKANATDAEQFEWVLLKKELADIDGESTKEKLIRRIKQNPLVPIGCAATTVALGYGLWNFQKGNSKMSQMMMRARVGAQGFTVIALVVGVVVLAKS